jgi:hypothetical protein
VVMCGAAPLDELVWAPRADGVLLPQSVEKTPSATDCLVVVAGVSVGGRAPESAVAEAWLLEGGAEKAAEAAAV